jgi:hypothetical protein
MQDHIEKERLDRLGKRIVIGVVFIALVLSIIILIVNANTPELDNALCPKEGPSAETVVIIDRTDPLTLTQKEFISKRVRQLADNLKQYERVSVYGLSDDMNTWNASPVRSICNPGSSANPFYQNPKKIRDLYERKFLQPIESDLSALQSDHASQYSPIMEMVESVSLRPELSRVPPKRHFVIVSDMMQNTPEYSHYKLPISYQNFATSPYAKSQRVSLRKASVEVIYLDREELKKYQQTQHIEFWQQWFYEGGAKMAPVIRVR